ncbi:dihydrofolate reductase [Kingella potus]|uniref:dihydrofolate reductase n=1 Tax=Kingella potus TaxID=265175 RepID=UPI001FD1DFC6|nr:dihydrofolate reductase [Kingella potus]UOP00082.1 dihydrofolate reductase [Kingella potus]
MQKITLIAACAENGVIGIGNRMPWHLPEDFAFFKAYTLGKPVVMGRKTWESLPKKPLPGRRNIVVTRQAGYAAEGAQTVSSLAAAFALCADEAETVVMGGGEIYREALPQASDLRITEIALLPQGDAFFPAIDAALWRENTREERTAANGLHYAFVHYVRRL